MTFERFYLFLYIFFYLDYNFVKESQILVEYFFNLTCHHIKVLQGIGMYSNIVVS